MTPKLRDLMALASYLATCETLIGFYETWSSADEWANEVFLKATDELVRVLPKRAVEGG